MFIPNGTILRSFAAPDPSNYTNGRAVAFDGTNLWITDADSNLLTLVDPLGNATTNG